MQATSKITSIPIIDVMDRLGIRYFHKSWWEYGIYDQWEKTSGRSFNKDKNIVKDFSSWRAEWDAFWFVMSKLSLSEHETFKRFEDNFYISEKKTIKDIWIWLPNINQTQAEYLKTRWIDSELVKWVVKDYQWSICCLIRDNDWPVGGNARTLRKEHDKRFVGISGYSTKWIYKHKIDDTKNYLIVVEWLIDFLTLRQFDTNVVGIKSSDCWQDQIKELAKKFDLIVCNDNDQAGQKIIDNLKGINYKRFDLSKYGNYKDINDLHMDAKKDDIVQFILWECKETTAIQWTFEKMYSMQKIMNTQWKLWEDWPFEFYNRYTQGIVKWKVYTIWAYSNVWKSKFAYYHVQRRLKQKKKVLFINLEVDEAMCLMNVVMSHDNVWYKDIIGMYKPTEDDYKWLTIIDSIRSLEWICEVVESMKPDYVVIDFVQNIQNKSGTDYEKHAKTAIELQSLAIRTWCTIFSLSQVSNSMWKQTTAGDTSFVTLKWSWEYYASSDVVAILYRSDDNLCLKLAKNKFWPNSVDIEFKVDRSRNQFTQERNSQTDHTSF